jgi:hypothetical protein
MPVAHIILHAYASWHPDHPDGWHQHGQITPLRPHQNLAAHRRDHQRWPAVAFAQHTHPDLITLALDICHRRSWQFHAIALTPTHIHLVISWRTPHTPLQTQSIFKRLFGWKLATLLNTPGRRWFSDGGLPTPIHNPAHLAFLLNEYLPHQADTFHALPHHLTW